MRMLGLLVVALVVILSRATPAQQPYPDRPIRLVVPYATGGGTDLMARIIGQELSKDLGQSVFVDNKPGAGGIIGTDLVAKARPDGYTLGLISSGHAINAALTDKLPFDPIGGVTSVIQVAVGPNVIVVNSGVPARSLSDLITLVRGEPERFSFGSAGTGNPTHLAGELFQRATQSKLIHVPYKGSGQAEMGLAGGEITMIIDSIPAALPFISSGKTRALAVTGDRRFPLLPDVPTAREAGLTDYEMITWWGVVAPPGMPAELVARLNGAIGRILQRAEIREQFLSFGAEPAPGTADQFGRYIKSETERYAGLIRSLGLQTSPDR